MENVNTFDLSKYITNDIVFEIFKHLTQKDILACRFVKIFHVTAKDYVSRKIKSFNGTANFFTLNNLCFNGEYIIVSWLFGNQQDIYLFIDAGIYGACKGGHKDLVSFVIEKGARNWNLGLWGHVKEVIRI